LSLDGTVACSTCHDPARAFTDGRPVSIGVTGRAGERNAPTILNALYDMVQFWDGRAKTLEEQAILPIINPSEMGQPSLDAAVAGSQQYRNTSGHFAAYLAVRLTGTILCAPSLLTSVHKSHSIPHSITS
jgi:cytochrome c peroxidase